MSEADGRLEWDSEEVSVGDCDGLSVADLDRLSSSEKDAVGDLEAEDSSVGDSVWLSSLVLLPDSV